MVLSDEQVIKTETEMLRVESGTMMSGAESVRYLILHCSATRVTQDYPPEQMERDHKARGFRTIGYHFYIRKDGYTKECRKVLEVGAHCRPYNRCSIGICYEGGLDADGNAADTRTPEQVESMTSLLTMLHGMFPEAKIRGHRDMPGATPKECPCFDASEFEYIEDL
jgi:N-acetyl-anhydromuramyl-L-alanine amidase AmpD